VITIEHEALVNELLKKALHCEQSLKYENWLILIKLWKFCVCFSTMFVSLCPVYLEGRFTLMI